jgi:penicillin-binding protein 2
VSSSSLRPPPPRRTVRIGSRPLVQPISVADAGFFRSGGFYLRVSGLGAVTLIVFALLGLRLWSLQLVQGPRYVQEARRDVFRTVRLPAPRGAIVDAKGRVLADTEGRVSVTADADALGSLDERGRWHPTEEGLAILRRFARLTGTPVSRFVARIQREQLRTPHAPAVVVSQARRPLAVYLHERPGRFPGLHVMPYPERSYPQGRIGSEFLGLLGEISKEQLEQRRYRRHRMGEVIGQSGVEATYDRHLNSGLARARVAVDARGHPIGPLTVVDQPRPSRVLKLTIDARLQRATEQAIRYGISLARKDGNADSRAGAAVVMDARTGALRALASYPNYNQVRAARDRDYDERLVRSPDGLLNRAIAGTYPAGSTFKPIVAQAALSAGLISPWSTLPCTSAYHVGATTFRNVVPMSASLTLRDALKVSCDTWFYQLGHRFYLDGSLDIQRWARRLGLGGTTGLDLPGEAGGIVPTPEWLRRTHKQVWYPGQSIILAIGQGFLTVTPLQMAVAYAALANGGRVVTPHVGQGLYGQDGRLRKRFRWPAKRVKLVAPEAIASGLHAAANLPFGTSTSVFADFPVEIAGKTGTAEVPPRNDHSWYASWAPYRNPRYVVVVLIEHGGFGAVSAAPAARKIYEALYRTGPRDARP